MEGEVFTTTTSCTTSLPPHMLFKDKRYDNTYIYEDMGADQIIVVQAPTDYEANKLVVEYFRKESTLTDLQLAAHIMSAVELKDIIMHFQDDRTKLKTYQIYYS